MGNLAKLFNIAQSGRINQLCCVVLIVKKRTIVQRWTILSRLFLRVTGGENEPLLLERVLKSFRKLAEFLRPLSGRPIYSPNPFFRRNFLHAVTGDFSHGYETSANLREITKEKEFQ